MIPKITSDDIYRSNISLDPNHGPTSCAIQMTARRQHIFWVEIRSLSVPVEPREKSRRHSLAGNVSSVMALVLACRERIHLEVGRAVLATSFGFLVPLVPVEAVPGRSATRNPW